MSDHFKALTKQKRIYISLLVWHFFCNCPIHRIESGQRQLSLQVPLQAVPLCSVQRAYCSLSIDIKNENCNANISADVERHKSRSSSSRGRCKQEWSQCHRDAQALSSCVDTWSILLARPFAGMLFLYVYTAVAVPDRTNRTPAGKDPLMAAHQPRRSHR